ncbi:MAG: helicase-related protein [Propionibacteriaceae bacterium]
MPTDAYSLDEAVADGYLVPPQGVWVGTKFLRTGIRYAELSEDEKDQWDSLEWGDGGTPAEISTEELNRFLFNEDTVDKALATLMSQGYRVAGGDRIGKTIIFAKNKAHAEFIQQRYDIGWPQHAGHHARVIVHGSSYAQTLIDDFSTPEKPPHIAISVDMLDTGIDVHEVVNLVFFKMVRSLTKFWQMIGRGTRLRPDLFGPGHDKADFFVFDFCGNLEYFGQNQPGTEGSLQKSLAERLFGTRLALIHGLDTLGAESDLRSSTADGLYGLVAAMTLDNVLVRPHRRAVEQFSVRTAWDGLSNEDLVGLHALSGLPTPANDDDEFAKRFDLLMLRRQLAQLEGDHFLAERLREAIQGLAEALLRKENIPAVAAQIVLIESVAGDEGRRDAAHAGARTAETARPRAVRGRRAARSGLHRLRGRARRTDRDRSARWVTGD